MAQSRAKGTGSVYQRKDGKWVAAVWIDGKKVVRYGKTSREAQLKLKDLLTEQQQGTLTPPSKLTTEEWVQQWLAIVEPRLRPSTMRIYRRVLGIVVAEVGHVRLDKLTPLSLTRVFTRLQQEGRGPRQLQHAHVYFRTCLSHAVDLGVLRTNPMEKVAKPHWTPKNRRYWSIEEATRFVREAMDSPSRYGPLFVVLVTTGLRISEAFGLQWGDVDLVRQTLQIRRALVEVDNRYVMMPPKSKAGSRTVSLPAAAVEALTRLGATSDQTSEDFIFRTQTGNPPFRPDLYKRMSTLCRRASVPTINLHGLRHVAAMLALEATGDIYLVQQRLGHSHVNVTLGIYGYPSRSEAAVAPALDRLLATTSDDVQPSVDADDAGERSVAA